MKNTIKSRKGVTLTELVVVLAVVVIAAGMVVTFSSMMHGAQGISNERYEALQDVRTAEALIEGFIENNADKTPIIPEETTVGGNKLYFEDKCVFLANGGAFVMTDREVIFFEHVTRIDFSIESTSFDTLYYCTITYEVAKTPYTYTFCVNPYVGEGVN